MEIINVIVIVDGVVNHIDSFKHEHDDDVKEAQELFCSQIRQQINKDFTDDQMNEFISDGYCQSDSMNLSVCITWSRLD
jgi:hypothetical protein